MAYSIHGSSGFSGKRYGVAFEGGKAETDDRAVALALLELGYRVEPDPTIVEPDPTIVEPDPTIVEPDPTRPVGTKPKRVRRRNG
ncbi:MAG: hypothetical protein KatS3mg051_1579 [Anaerolineae bacterium]|nr:MAG: hypothetical protein KatS3mg051_1579 [Anaerolineae bacterium]